MKKMLAFAISAALALLLPASAVPQCIVPANGAVVKTAGYSPLAADTGKLFVMNCSTSCTVTLPAAPQSPVWMIFVESIGAGAVTISPNGLTLNGAAASQAMPVAVGSTVTVWTDNSNYFSAGAAELGTYRYRSCDIAVGDASGSALANAQLGPQKRICYIPAASTIVEMDVAADAGTPNVIVAVNHAGTPSNIVSSALATASAGGIACSKLTAVTGLDGATTCAATLQNTSIAAGDYIELVSGTAGGTAKLMTIHVIYTVN